MYSLYCTQTESRVIWVLHKAASESPCSKNARYSQTHYANHSTQDVFLLGNNFLKSSTSSDKKMRLTGMSVCFEVKHVLPYSFSTNISMNDM